MEHLAIVKPNMRGGQGVRLCAVMALAASVLAAQPSLYVIDTFAGRPDHLIPESAPARDLVFDGIAMQADDEGNVYVADHQIQFRSDPRILKITPDGRFSVLRFGIDPSQQAFRDFLVTPSGEVVLRVAELGSRPVRGQLERATVRDLLVWPDRDGHTVELRPPNRRRRLLAIDDDENVYYNQGPTIWTVSFDGEQTLLYDPFNVSLPFPAHSAVSHSGDVYFTAFESGVGTVYRLEAPDRITRFAELPNGRGSNSLLVDIEENVYVGLHLIGGNSFELVRISPSGTSTRIAGRGSLRGTPTIDGGGSLVDETPAVDAELLVVDPDVRLATDARGNVILAIGGRQGQAFRTVRRIRPDGIMETVAGGPRKSPSGVSRIEALFSFSGTRLNQFLGFDAEGSLYASDHGNRRAVRIEDDGSVVDVPEVTQDDGVPFLWEPRAIGIGPDGSTYWNVSDPDGLGDLTVKRSPDGSQQTLGSFFGFTAVGRGVDLAVTSGRRILRMNEDGARTVLAGNGTQGFSEDGTAATRANLVGVDALAVGSDGTVYFSESSACRIRKIDRDGTLQTVGGSPEHCIDNPRCTCSLLAVANPSGSFPGVAPGEGGPAREAQLGDIGAIVASEDGSLYFTERALGRIRRVRPDGIIETIAGEGNFEVPAPDENGDGGLAINARLSALTLAQDRNGNLYTSGLDGLIRILKPAGSHVFLLNGVANAASFNAETFAPGSWASLFGRNFIAATAIAQTAPLPTSLEGRTITITDSAGVRRQAALQFVAPGQANFLIPEETAPGPAMLTFEAEGGSESLEMEIAAVAPGLFSAKSSGTGVAAAFFLRVGPGGEQTVGPVFKADQNGQIVFESLPINNSFDQLFLLLFGTGLRSAESVQVRIDGVEIPVVFFGSQGEFDGLDQVNIGPLPDQLKENPGVKNLELMADGKAANIVQVGLF